MTDLPGPVLTARGGAWQVADHGAQVLAWAPAGHRPVIWFDPSWPAVTDDVIVGGIPLCTPWFGHGPDDDHSRQHGLARVTDFDRHTVTPTDGTDGEALQATWSGRAGDITVRHQVRMSDEDLAMRLTLTNGTDGPEQVEAMWHTYYRVGDAMATRVEGLGEAAWWNTASGERGRLEDGVLGLAPGTDTVVQGVGGELGLVDPTWGRRIAIATTGCPTVVVWNPHRDDEPTTDHPAARAWRDFVCVETGFAKDNCVVLAPGEDVSLTTTITVEGLPG